VNRLPEIPISYHTNIEQYKGRNDPDAVKAVAKEMESLFAYEMIKAMRATVGASSENTLGNDTYMSLFDMQLARLFAERGLGLQDMIAQGMNKRIQKTDSSGAGAQQPTAPQSASQQPSTQQSTAKSDQVTPHETQEPAANLPLSSPVDGGVVSSPFGMRRHPIHGDMRFHKGVDIAAPAGTDIHPVRKGTVTFSGQQAGYGNVVVIDHGNGLVTKYAHNQINLVKTGDEVDTTTVIAQVGSTGEATGPHVHFEVSHDGKTVDPSTYFAKR
jgi:murein DD-endopeptidase MepM/ murein hydrolase activator NlpD